MKKMINALKKNICVLGIAVLMSIGVSFTATDNMTYAMEAKSVDIQNSTKEEFTGVASPAEENKHGWVPDKGGFKYYGKDGLPYTGWHEMGKAEGESIKHWSYFGKDGVIYTGWHEMGKDEGESVKHWSYFGSNGWLQTGWKEFASADGESTPHWSYFGSNGWLQTGWKEFTKADGESTPHWSYFGSNGWLQTGWKEFTKADGESTPHWSYFGSNGWLQTGWKEFTKADGESIPHWSFFGSNGWLRTGLQNMGAGTSNSDGSSVKHQSFFGNNGWLIVNQTLTVKGNKFKADSRGWLIALKNKTVVIDAGHQTRPDYSMEPNGPGSSVMKRKVSSGTEGIVTRIPEYKLNLNVSLKLRDELKKRGYTVIMIRETNDVNLSNAQRAQIANSNKADVFIHVHANGDSNNKSTNGCMTLCQTKNNPYNSYLYSKCRLLADCVLNKFSAATGARALKVWETDTMTGINWSKVPVTTIEMGYMSNPQEDRKMQDPNYQKKMVTGIADGIDEYIRRIQ